jgi:hypothetical protein
MKKYLLTLAAVLFSVFTVTTVLTACSSDDDEELNTVYACGFDQLSTSDISELSIIENAFYTALGITSSPFTYTGGDAKVKEACEQAAATLSKHVFKGRYTYVVTKANGDNVYTWSN